ncbi:MULTISPECIES: ATP-binding protein [Actinoplanes]|uniref:sensor histidine kinase n=1 Tax=Actinoplanes TaxID=1865 RepID=UPI0012FC1FB5|nr:MULTISPECIES: ATP-binding protein [Actinoplanes]
MSNNRITGPVETSVRAGAARLAVIARVIVVVGCTVLLPVGAPVASSVVIVGVVLVWQAVSLLAGRRPRWAAAVDVIPLAAACVLLPWLDPPHGYLDLEDWSRPVTSICVGVAQILTRPWAGLGYALVAAAAMWAGSSLATGDGWDHGTTQATMLLWQAGMARALIELVVRNARRVDELTRATAAAERDAELTTARRADVKEHLAVLHDTVAATLTAASARGAGGPELRRRARSELSLLEPASRLVTVADLGTPPDGGTLDVTVTAAPPDQAGTIPPYAVDALLAARDEALRNVERHAGTGRAAVTVRHPEPGVVEVDVTDDGCGFRPEEVPGGVHLGLRLSVEERMRRAGGSARVVSAPGHGTRIALRWPAA